LRRDGTLGQVVMSVGVSDATEAAVSPAHLTFDAADWDQVRRRTPIEL
jgi:hypothetical protein